MIQIAPSILSADFGRINEEIAAIQARVAELPVLDDRPIEQLVEYDDVGLPG